MKLKFIKLKEGGKVPAEKDTFYESCENLSDVGLKIPRGYVLVDFDSHNDKEKMVIETLTNNILLNYPTFNVKTDRGRHLYYKKPKDILIKDWTACTTVCGVPVDYKTSYGKIKSKGMLREMSDSFDNLDFSKLSELPHILYPLKKSKNNLLAMKDGDGRNSTLYKHLLCLKETYDLNIKDIGNYINDNVFVDKLNSKELETLIESAVSKETENTNFYDGKTLKVNVFANFLIKNEHICKINGLLHVFKDGVYVNGNREIESVMLKHIPVLLSAKRTEVLKMLDVLILNDTELAPPNFIAFNNGIYDLFTKQLFNFDPDIVITNKIPWNYNKDANNELVNKVLNDWADNTEALRKLLEEVIGMCMYRSNKITSCFILTGDKDNGKSTFVNLLKILLGKKNYSSVALEDIETRFKNAELFGKLANLGDDIGDRYIDNTATFKKLVTGETVQLERKGKDPFDFENYGKLIFNANTVPRIKDETGAVIDKRITIIPFQNDFSGKKKDVDLINKIKKNEFMETLILVALNGIERVLENKGFTSCDILIEIKKQYKFDNDIVARFIAEYGEENIRSHNTKPIIEAYKEFCKENNSTSGSTQKLNKGLKRILGCEVLRHNDKVLGKVKTTYYYSDGTTEIVKK